MKTPTLETRKPVVKLRRPDLLAFPGWEYATEEEGAPGQDETWVRPGKAEVVPRGKYSLLVAADLTSAGGRTFLGFMVVTTAARSVEVDPGALIAGARYLPLPVLTRQEAREQEAPWDLARRDGVLEGLGQDEDEVFPLRYRLRVPVGKERGCREGEVG